MKMLMKELDLNELTVDLINAPALSWQEIIDKQLEQDAGIESLNAAVWELDALIQKATRLRGYVAARCNGDHLAGVKESNKLVRPIRKALGFTVPRHDILF
jgi:hypothetical protein